MDKTMLTDDIILRRGKYS